LIDRGLTSHVTHSTTDDANTTPTTVSDKLTEFSFKLKVVG